MGDAESGARRRSPERRGKGDGLLAVSETNSCEYGIACHTALARKAGMTDQMFTELLAVVGMANQTNRFADGFRLPIDESFNQ